MRPPRARSRASMPIMLTRFIRSPALGLSLFLATACDTSVVGGDGDDGAGGGTVSSGTSTGTSSTTGSGSAGGPLDCGAHVRCATDLGDGDRPCEGGSDCSFVPGCLTAICVSADEACPATCLDSACYILESYPSQIACEGAVTEAVDDVTCDEVMAELAAIQSCTTDDECGLVLEGTSCGCTRDLVARLDAPVDIFQTLWAASTDCSFGSTCDCPPADGFECVEGICSWRYTP